MSLVERLLNMGALIAIIDKRGENADETAIAMLKILRNKNTESFGLASPVVVKIEKSLDSLSRQNINSPIIIGCAFSRLSITDRFQLTKIEGATFVFEGRLYPTTAKKSGVKVSSEKLQRNHEKTLETLIREAEGDFAFALAEPEKLIAGRDAMGIRPLYYGESADFAALASERKALWNAGIRKIGSFPPGNLAFVYKRGFTFKPIKTITYSKPKQVTMQIAVKKLQELLQQSIKERVTGLKEVAVAFSGGLDSSTVAFLIKKIGVNPQLIHVSLENQKETEQAKKAAEELELPIHLYLYDERNVEKTLPKILWLIEEPDPVKASIGIPVYWAAEKTAEMNLNVMLAGQGADELFGGYKRYTDDYSERGSEIAHKTMFNDIVRMHEINFERDFKICNFHNVELRLPFATYQIAKFAADLPVDLKIELLNNRLRKLVLRRTAENFGLPFSIAKKPKRAIQYASGVNKALRKLAATEELSTKEYVQRTFQAVRKKMRMP